MNDEHRRTLAGPSGPKLSELAEATGVGIEKKIFATLYDTLIRPGLAARAAFDRADTHVSQLKLFAALAGLYFSAAAFFEAPMTLSLETLVTADGVSAANAFILNQGADPGKVEASLARWGGLLLWPTMLVASLVYIAVLKMLKPSVTWFGHVLIYLIATNAMTLIGIPLMAGRLISLEVFLILQMSTFLVFYIQLIRLGSSPLDLGAGRLILFGLLSLVAVFPSVLIMGLLQFASAWFILGFHDVSLLEMMDAAIPE